ncbi:Uncharacterised protein [Mycobacteroides abscessus subsp. abscessus]|nr:Uncharacterised protein [Mycobacteroides abscessus subsp. abscessus]
MGVEELGDGEDGADAHLVGGDSGDGHAPVDPERGQSPPGRLGVGHEDGGRGTVGELGGVARGDARLLRGDPRLEDGCELREPLERRLGAVALVLGQRDLLRGRLPGLLVENDLRRGQRDDLVVEAACLLRGGGALLRFEGVGVLVLAADPVAFGDDLSGREHRVVDPGNVLLEPRVLRPVGVHVLVLDEGDGFDATADSDLLPVDDDLLRGGGDRHEARGALAVDGHAGDRDGQSRPQTRLTADVRRLAALLEGRADDDVINLGAFDTGAFDGVGDRVSGELLGLSVVERTAVGPPDRGSGGGDDDGIDHGVAPSKAVRWGGAVARMARRVSPWVRRRRR